MTANLTLPMSPDTLPVAGCLAVLPVVQGDVRGSEGEIRIASRRGDALLDPAGRLTVNAIRVGNVGVSLEDIEAALGVADALYVDNGAGTLADIEFFDVATDAGAFVPSNGAALNDLRSTPIEGSSRAMNIYFIEDFTDAPGVLGVAAGIPGPNGIPQTPGSGVVVALTSHRTVDGVVNTTLMGETIAHELGHQLGLFHTSESDGSGHDVVDDTAECTLADDANGDGQLAAEECPDGANVMFWTSASFSQSTMSASQSDVLFFSPVSE
ncbi:MAG: M12 family metallo-peptidase [Planctomycetota bacterium]